MSSLACFLILSALTRRTMPMISNVSPRAMPTAQMTKAKEAKFTPTMTFAFFFKDKKMKSKPMMKTIEPMTTKQSAFSLRLKPSMSWLWASLE